MVNSYLRQDDSGPPDEVRACVHDLFQAHYAELCRFVHRLVKSRALAEELVQDVFLRIWQHGGTAGPGRAPVTRPYLYRAVRNQALDHIKHQRVEQGWAKRFQASEPDETSGLMPERRLDAASLARAARGAIDQLPERCRLVFLLRREQGLSYSEIAATMGVSVKTVENHMGRALRLLRQSLAAYLSVSVLAASAAEVLRLMR